MRLIVITRRRSNLSSKKAVKDLLADLDEEVETKDANLKVKTQEGMSLYKNQWDIRIANSSWVEIANNS